MPLVEVDSGELDAHRRVTDTMRQLLSNPKTRREVLKLQKELNPNLVIPELDAAAPVQDALTAMDVKFSELAKRLDTDAEERAKEKRLAQLQSEWDKGRSLLRSQGYTDEGLAAVEKFMEEKGIRDHDVAAAAYERLNPPSEPIRSVGGNRFDLFEPEARSDDKMKALFENPEDPMALDAMINDALKTARGR